MAILLSCCNVLTSIQDFKGGGRRLQDRMILSVVVMLMLLGLSLASPTYDPILSLIAKYPRYSSYFVSRWYPTYLVSLRILTSSSHLKVSEMVGCLMSAGADTTQPYSPPWTTSVRTATTFTKSQTFTLCAGPGLRLIITQVHVVFQGWLLQFRLFSILSSGFVTGGG